MSAEYRPTANLDYATMLAQVSKLGIREDGAPTHEIGHTWRPDGGDFNVQYAVHRLTNGEHFLFACVDDGGFVFEFTTRQMMRQHPIVVAIETACGITI